MTERPGADEAVPAAGDGDGDGVDTVARVMAVGDSPAATLIERRALTLAGDAVIRDVCNVAKADRTAAADTVADDAGDTVVTKETDTADEAFAEVSVLPRARFGGVTATIFVTDTEACGEGRGDSKVVDRATHSHLLDVRPRVRTVELSKPMRPRKDV